MADAIAGNQRALTLQATTDALTGLANRSTFHDRLDAALRAPQRRNGNQAVLYIDVDDFKDVNDSLGHGAGDHVLRLIATRISDAVRPGDLVARVGGDEFAVLLEGIVEIDDAMAVAQRMLRSVTDGVTMGSHTSTVSASVGVSMRRPDSTVDSLMHEADVAMYAAKANGKNCVERYDASLDDVAFATRQTP
jgi:diguanylate cyclase (GGDEF)-like protein